MRKDGQFYEFKHDVMVQSGLSANPGDVLLNIFPNPCIGDTYLYTDDLEAAWVMIYDYSGDLREQWPIIPGRTLHVSISLAAGTYQIVLKDHYQNILGLAKSLFISESH